MQSKSPMSIQAPLMNIAFFSKQLPSDHPNGVSVQVHRLAEALTARKHTVTVHTFSPPVAGAHYQHAPLKPFPRSRIRRKFHPAFQFRKVKHQQFDIMHYHGDDYLCRGTVKRIRTFYGSARDEALHAATPGRFFYQGLFYLFELLSCRRKGILVGISKTTCQSLPAVKQHIPCCIPTGIFTPGKAKTSHPSILFLGDFNSRKRGSALLKIFSTSILPEYPKCTLTVVGPQPCSGPNIIYAGRSSEPELIELYRKHWIFCMPSSYEGFGVPLLEAMACGTAVVATENPGSEEIILHRENGLLCNLKQLSEVLKKCLYDTELRERLAAHGRTYARQYDADCCAAHYERIYRKIISR